MEPYEEINIREQFDVRHCDPNNKQTDRTFAFTKAHLDQGVIANPQMFGMDCIMKNDFPLTLRLGKFVPEKDRMVYTVRNATRRPWEDEKKKKDDSYQALYVPKSNEETHKFTPEGSETEYQLRCTDLIGPKAQKHMQDEIQ